MLWPQSTILHQNISKPSPQFGNAGKRREKGTYSGWIVYDCSHYNRKCRVKVSGMAMCK